jgi:hypothetical protein
VGDKTKTCNTRVQSVENKIAALATYRMTKSLCRKCGEKWNKGHQCADSVQLNVLQEIWDLIDDEAAGAGDSTDESTTEQLFLALSEADVAGVEAPRTLKTKGSIQHLHVLVLIDSSSSHSFISEQVANQLQGFTRVVKLAKVEVVNENIIQSSVELLQAEWAIQGFVFCSDLKVLPLHSFDMEWLEHFSPMKIH